MSASDQTTVVPPIDEAVYLLSQYAPESLKKLQNDLPELAAHLVPGGEAGPADPLITARARVCATTLENVAGVCELGIKNAQDRLRRQKTLALIGGITATLASASVIASLSASYSFVAFAAGVISLTGSLAALLSEHVGKIPRTDLSLFDAYRRLVEYRSDSRLVGMELCTHLETGLKEENVTIITEIIGKSEVLFKKVHDILAALEIAAETK